MCPKDARHLGGRTVDGTFQFSLGEIIHIRADTYLDVQVLAEYFYFSKKIF